MQIIKVPGINSFGMNDGARNAGNAIISVLEEIWSSEKGKIIDKNLLDIEEIHVNNSDVEEQEKLIYENSLEAFEKGDKIIFLGGDHSISFATVKAFFENCRKNDKEPCLIVFDAHPDVMPPMKNSSHEEWVRALIELGFPKENILLIGLRNSEPEEIKFLGENKIRQISVNRIAENIQEASDVIMEFAYGKELYLSFDIDVVDPAFAPSTGYPEPGGLTGRQAIYIIQRMAMMRNLRAVDIVEVNSEKDKTGMTVKLAGKLLAELL